MNPVDRFHASWPRGVSPSVVEHFGGAADHVAAAMTLWSGAERIASLLSTGGLAPGDRVACALAPGVRWVQTFLACLMRDVVFCPLPPGERPLAPTRALIDEQAGLTVGAPAPGLAAGTAVCLPDGVTLSVGALDAALEGFGAVPRPRNGARVCAEAPWWDPAGLLGCVWLGLSSGAELHVGLTDEESHRLGPEAVAVRPRRVAATLAWLPTSIPGVVVMTGEPTPDDRDAAARRGWPLVLLPLPAGP